MRLSSEDGDNAETDSIGNQRQIIQDFLKNEDNVVIVDYYSYLKDKKCCVKSIQKEYLEKLIIQLLNNFRSVINEMDEQITNITNLKKVNYDFDILKFKISNVEEDIDKYIKLRNEIKEDLTEKFITEEEYWEYSDDYSKKISKLNKEKNKLNEELEKITKYDMNNLHFLEKIKK